jgi:hypothetical protein
LQVFTQRQAGCSIYFKRRSAVANLMARDVQPNKLSYQALIPSFIRSRFFKLLSDILRQIVEVLECNANKSLIIFCKIFVSIQKFCCSRCFDID